MEAAVLRKPETPAAKPCEPAGQPDREPRQSAGLPIFLQAKLAVNPPGDPLEKEADRVALAATSSSHSCPDCSAGAPCRKCASGPDAAQSKAGRAGYPIFTSGRSEAIARLRGSQESPRILAAAGHTYHVLVPAPAEDTA